MNNQCLNTSKSDNIINNKFFEKIYALDKVINNIIKDVKNNLNVDCMLCKNYYKSENKLGGSNDFLAELLVNQLKNVCSTKKLNYGDIKRISKFISSSIFNKDVCSIWNGYITNEKKNNKGTYINFYFKKKKIALHRLLYHNYIGELSDKEYIKFNCVNKGKCCNIYHMSKYSYKDCYGLNDNLINNDKQSKSINITYQENDLSLII